jgi:hypothetical protein
MRLYLPEGWARDKERRGKAGIGHGAHGLQRPVTPQHDVDTTARLAKAWVGIAGRDAERYRGVMITTSELDALLRRIFPLSAPSWRLVLPERGDIVTASEEEAFLRLQLWELDDQGNLASITEQECRFRIAGTSLPRWEAFLTALERAFPALAERDRASEPVHFCCADVLHDERCRSAEDFERVLREPATLDAWLNKLMPLCGVADERYEAFLQETRSEDPGAARHRRASAFEEAMARFPAVAAHVRTIYGLELPGHVALAWAFFKSLSEEEWVAFEDGVELVERSRLEGIFPFFEEGGLQLPMKAGVDPRVHLRKRITPVELLPLFEDSGGNPYGLFYDDPSYLPSGVASVARYGEVQWDGETIFDVIREAIDTRTDFGAEERTACQCRWIHDILADFAEHETRIRAEDRARMRWSFDERRAMADGLFGVGIATDLGDGGKLAYMEEVGNAHDFLRDTDALRGWIREAREALASGDPRYALALGRDLYAALEQVSPIRSGELERWEREDDPAMAEAFPALSVSDWKREARALMAEAYRALGREALAQIAELPAPPAGEIRIEVYERPNELGRWWAIQKWTSR